VLPDSKRGLLKGLSHELRAPLQSLLGHVDLLRSGAFGGLTDDQAAALDSVANSAEKILDVTRDVLQVARIDSGHEHVEAHEVDLDELIEGELDSFRPLAESAGLSLERDGETSLRVVSDGRKIARILTSLLDNALKYTAHGGIVLGARRAGEQIVIEVRDTGAGIPEDKREAVFEEYVRASPAGEGTGLGLTIARRLARLLRGDLSLESRSLESEVDHGTTVRLELPINED